MRKRRRTNYALEAIRLVISTIMRTNYPANVKIERLRALHMVLDNFKTSIRSLDDWDELKRLEDTILKESAELRKTLPPGVVTHF